MDNTPTNWVHTPISAHQGIRWPAVSGGYAASVMALVHQLLFSERWSATEILRHQLLQTEELIAHAARTTSFYDQRLRFLGDLKRGQLCLDRFRDIPILTRPEVQDALADLTSRALPEDHGAVEIKESSGSTGRPVRIHGTGLTKFFFLAMNLRSHIWHGIDLAATVAAIRVLHGREREIAANGDDVGWATGYRTGPMRLFDVRIPISRQWAWLDDLQPDYLLTLPSNLRALIGHGIDLGADAPALRRVMTMSEIIDADLRDECRSAWGVEIIDNYSAQEVGFIALQCPEHTHYHVMAENLLVEVVSDDGRPCAPGEIGRVVVTDLHNFATPLLRYAIGDYAEVGASCACGRGLPVLNRILGRVRNMITYPNGDQAWPVPVFSGEIIDNSPVRQLQLAQTGIEDIEVRLVVARRLDATEKSSLISLIQHRLGYDFHLDLKYLDDIPRSAGGKYEDFISLLDE